MNSNIIAQIAAAERLVTNVTNSGGPSFAFTGKPVADELLTEWAIEFKDDESTLLPIQERAIYKLYHLDKSVLVKFIREGKSLDDVPTAKELCTNLNNATQWELVYLILELEDRGRVNENIYPRSLWELIAKV